MRVRVPQSRPAWASAAGPVIGMLLAALLSAQLMAGRPAFAASAVAGSAGTDTSLPLTPSAVTVSGRGVFKDLKITVNQTTELVNQAVSVTWTGGNPTYTNHETSGFNGTFTASYLQMFQCWSKDARTPPTPEQCEFGAESPSGQDHFISETRQVDAGPYHTPPEIAAHTIPGKAFVDTVGAVVVPFLAADSTVVNMTVNHNWDTHGIPNDKFDTNPFFDHTTTNERTALRTYPDGTGQTLFQVTTAFEAPGLGCGLHVQPVDRDDSPSGPPFVPQCWLVIAPRGTLGQEGASILGGLPSPLLPAVWNNVLPVPLEFQPLESPCALGTGARAVIGGEVAARAVASWQPTLCLVPGSQPFNYTRTDEGRARAQLLDHGGMAVVSRPLDASAGDPATPLVYAPLSLSGVVVAFNIERAKSLDVRDPETRKEVDLEGKGVVNLNLTPRLVAKLLTESYLGQLGLTNLTLPPEYRWGIHNPKIVQADPEFLQYNPEFTLTGTPGGGRPEDLSGLVVEAGSGDATDAVWQWILSDPEAKAWLGGKPDASGMTVNPYYNTDASVNPLGVGFAVERPSIFPKSDPLCSHPGHDIDARYGLSQTEPPRPQCMLDRAPYVGNMAAGARAARAANSGAKVELDHTTLVANDAWKSAGPQLHPQFLMSVTTSDRAAQFGLPAARLSRAGDDTSNREFVAPDANGLLAGQRAMVPSGVEGVLAPNPAATTAGAYPLALLTYGVTAPVGLDDAARKDYARFVAYGAGPGQIAGSAFGTLPPGYVPLPADLDSQAMLAAAAIADPVKAPDPEATLPSSATTRPPASRATARPPGKTHPSTPTTRRPTTGGGRTTPTASGLSPTSSSQGTSKEPRTGEAPPDDVGSAPSAPSAVSAPAPTRTPSIALGAQRTTSAPAARVPGVGEPAAPAALTLALGVGLIRYAPPVLLALGLASAIATSLVGGWSRRRRVS